MTSRQEIFDRAVAQHRAGRADLAEPIYRQTVAEDKGHHQAWHLLGVIALQREQFAEAIAFLEIATGLDHTNPKYLNNLGNALGQSGNLAAAEIAFRRANDLDKQFADPLYNLGVIYHRHHNLTRAEALYREVLEQNPEHPGANNNLGSLYNDRGQCEEALPYFNKAVSSDPDFMAAHINIGTIAGIQGDAVAAARSFDRVLQHGDYDSILLRRGLLLPAIYDSVEQIDECRQAFEENLDRLIERGLEIANPFRDSAISVFYLAYHGRNDKDLQIKIANFYRAACPQLNYVSEGRIETRAPGQKIKIGFVSNNFRNHTVGKLNQGLIANLDKNEFELTVFLFRKWDEKITHFICDHADHVVSLTSDLRESMEIIAKRKLDILYYTDIGMDPFSYFLGFGRLAPVQCVAWGHPLSTGIDTIDYFISWELCELESAQNHYSEKLVKLRNLPTYYYRPDMISSGVRSEFGFSAESRLYVCVQSPFKLHPDMDAAFKGILEADSKAVVVLLSGKVALWESVLRARFDRTIRRNADRISFLPSMSEEKFNRLLDCADVLLDSFPFCGGNTSFESFAIGKPVVTLPSEYLRGRVTYAMYREMGIDDCVAADIEEYVSIALRLANDPDFNLEVCRKIRENNVQLFERGEAVLEFADFFRRVAAVS